MTVTFIEVFPVRVQQYITRWPDLKGRRGASAMLIEATASDELDSLLSRIGAERNKEAIAIDGALSVVVEDPSRVNGVKQALVQHLRSRCPAVEYSVVSATAASDQYWTVKLDKLDRAAVDGQAEPVLVPAYEVPTVRRCVATGVDPAVGKINASGEQRMVGIDAARRVRTNYESSHTAKLAKKIAAKPGGQELEQAPDFRRLSGLGPIDYKRNHLATVFADGNKIGALFAGLGENDRKVLSNGLKRATWGALVEASNQVDKVCVRGAHETGFLPVEPHIVGGDDVLVSVPAGAGLTFAREFSKHFSDQVRKETGCNHVSASVGIVYHHYSFPFNQAADLAGVALSTAKRYPGQPAVLALDTTRGAGEDARSDLVWPLSAIAQQELELARLAGLGRSLRSSLAGTSVHSTSAGSAEEQVSQARLELLLHRHELAGELASFATTAGMRKALHLTHWWPPPTNDEASNEEPTEAAGASR